VTARTHETRASEPTGGRLLTVAQVAELLGTSERFVYKLIAQRRIAYTKFGTGRGSPVRIAAGDVDAYVAAHRVEAQKTGAAR
jgi:excisionase family DNA binding protein